jgi:hypothetical protein
MMMNDALRKELGTIGQQLATIAGQLMMLTHMSAEPPISSPNTTVPLATTVVAAKTSGEDDTPIANSLPKANGNGRIAKVYKVRPGFNAKLAASLKGNNAKVWSAVKAAKNGIDAKTAATRAKVHPKTTESNLYQLRTMQLIDSHDAA